MKKIGSKERIEEILKAENDLVEETKAKISNLKEQYQNVKDQLEETYTSGNTALGEKLISERNILFSNIEYLEDFLKRRESVSLISDEEAKEMKIDLDEQMKKQFFKDSKELERIVNEIDVIVSKGIAVMDEVKETGNSIFRLQRRYNAIYGIDARIINMYQAFSFFLKKYNGNTLPYIRELKEKE